MKHSIGDVWQDKKGETYIKTEAGTKSYYRYLVEQYLGFPIPPGYSVHHINFDHAQNELSNLAIIPTALHTWIHRCGGTKDLLESNLDKIRDNPSILK